MVHPRRPLLAIAAFALSWGIGCDGAKYDDDDTAAADDDATAADDDDTAADDDDTTATDDDDDSGNVDGDGDGWIADLDCDDGNPEVHPGAFDWCGDQVDQDCSGAADDATLQMLPPVLSDEPFTYAPLSVGDFRGFGFSDVAVASYQLEVHLLHGDWSGTLAGSSQVAGISDALGVFGGDFDGDGDPDLVLTRQMGCPLRQLENNGSGVFSPVGDVPCSGTPAWGAVADLDGSGTPDLVLVDPAGAALDVFLGDGAGFTPLPPYTPLVQPWDVALADFDGDAWPDLVVSSSTGGVAALQGTGVGTFTSMGEIGGAGGAEIGVAADVDGDGLDDLVAVLADGSVEVARNGGDGAFEAAVPVDIPPGGRFATEFDATGDGLPEIVVCADGGLTFLINDGTGAFPTHELMLLELGGECRPTGLDLGGTPNEELLVSAPGAPGYYVIQVCD